MALLMLAPSIAVPSAAYDVTDVTFVGGSASGSLTFGPSDTALLGPSLRLLTNSTPSSASVRLDGSVGTPEVGDVRSGDSDFSAATVTDGLRLSNGRLGLENTTWTARFDVNNSFGGGTHASTTVLGPSLVPTGSTGGTYTTPLINNGGDGWGYLTASGEEPKGTDITFRLLDANGTVVYQNLEPGQRISLTSWEMPALSVQVVFSKPTTGPSPSVLWFAVGQQVTDTFLGSGQARTLFNLVAEGGNLLTVPETATLGKDSNNPLITRVSSSFRSTFVGQAAIIQVGPQWWMYFTAGSGADRTGAGITRAVSSDLASWAVDSGVLIPNGTSGFDSWAAANPYVMEDPAGSGYLMYYTGLTGPAAYSIGLATSPDGTNWTKVGQVFGPASTGWDSVSVGMVSRVTYDHVTGVWRMWYSGSAYSPGGDNNVGIANSGDGRNWTRYAGNPVLSNGGPGTIDADDAQGGKQIEVGSTVFYYYSCNPGGYYNVCLATSTNGGYSWSKVGTVINRSVSGWDTQVVADPAPVLTQDDFYVFYSGYQSGMPQIGRVSASFKGATLTGHLDLLGPDPDLINFVKDAGNPRLSNQAGTYYATFLSQPMIVWMNSKWTMYFSAGNQSGFAGATIGRATSQDLVNWAVDASPVLTPTAGTNDSWAAANPYVVAEPGGSGWRMYYSGHTGITSRHIMLATSTDGINWIKHGDVMPLLATGWDRAQVGIVGRVEFDASSLVWRMWYTGGAGGATSMGLATSPDGVSWTRYPSNPVMSPSSPFDTSELQAGKMLWLDGTLNMYYNCNSEGAWHVCLASSADGISWTKHGYALNRSSSGWDGVQSSDGFPVVAGGQFHLLFAGVSSGRSQIGHATGAFDPSAPRARLADLPRELARFVSSMSTGIGVAESITLRSSADRVSWSSPESVQADDATLSTPVQRFVQYTITLSAGNYRSTIQSTALELVSGRDTGRWMDDSFLYADPYDQFTAAALWQGAGSFDLGYSADGLSPFTPLPPGARITVGGSPTTAAIEGVFRGYSSGTLELAAVYATARTYGWPADVSVALGLSGTPLSVGAGSLSGPVSISLDPQEMADAIQAELVSSPGSAYVDVPLVVRSSHFGVVNITLEWLNYTLKNPLDASFLPAGNTLTILENTSQGFAISATSLPGVLFNYTWTIDGVLLGVSGSSFDYMADFDAAGSHWLNATVENGDFLINHSWQIEVVDVNRGPLVIETIPGGGVSQSHGLPVSLRVFADDPDGDALSYTWAIDGSPNPALTTNASDLTGLSTGDHTVSVEVSDGLVAVVHSWDITLLNGAPTIVARTPETALDVAAQQEFSVQASDPENDTLSVEWVLDGVSVGTGFAYTSPGNLPSGAHHLTVKVTDPFGESAQASWTYNVPAAADATVGLDLVVVGLILVMAVGAAVVLVFLRQRRPGE